MAESANRILFIDDDLEFAKKVGTFFENRGDRVFYAKSAESALKKLKITKPKFIVTDVLLPKMNGFELISRLNNNDRDDFKFIVVSNYGETSLLHDNNFAKSLGILKYLLKSNSGVKKISLKILEIINEEKKNNRHYSFKKRFRRI